MQTMNNRLTFAENIAAQKQDRKSGWIMTAVTLVVCVPVFMMVVQRIG